MNTDQFLDSMRGRFNNLAELLRAGTEGLSDEALNKPIEGWHWTLGQILEHVRISQEGMLTGLSKAVRAAPSKGATEHKRSFMGKFVIKAAGPTGKAKAPKGLIPTGNNFKMDLVDKVIEQIEKLRDLAKEAKGKSVSKISMTSPIAPISYSVADGFEICVVHLERHFQQIFNFRQKMGW